MKVGAKVIIATFCAIVIFLAGCVSNDAKYNTGGVTIVTKDDFGNYDIAIIEDKYGNEYIVVYGIYSGSCSCAIEQI